MQGINHYQPQLFVYVNLEDLIPQKHILRKIDKIFDLSFVRKLTAKYYCSTNGRPSIDPELFFRMILVGYIFGIKHDRRLCEDITCNIAYRWYCKLNLDDNVPDHSSLSKIRDRYGEDVFKEFFDEVIEICKKYGLVKGEKIITDSTLIEANASIDSMEAISTKENKEDIHFKEKLSNKTHKSKSDPDSSLAQKRGQARKLRYKVHTCIDGDSRVILDNKLTTGCLHESNIFIDQIEKIKRKYNLPIEEVIADRAYGSADNLLTLKKQGITTFIPLFSTRVGKISDMENYDFRYDQQKDVYICPRGKHLTRREQNKNWVVYRSKSKDCNECSEKDACIAPKSNKGYNLRKIMRSIYQNFYEKEKSRMKEKAFIEKLQERMWKIEGIIAEAKQFHCLARAKYRGLKKVQIQSYMIGATQNLKRVLSCLNPTTYLCVLLKLLHIIKKEFSSKNLIKLIMEKYRLLENIT